MATNQIYVDPSIAADSGAGTIGDPYGDLQYALNTATPRAGGDGDQFNIKAGTAELLTTSLSLATYGAPLITAPLIIRGYTSAANDGGIGKIDMQANAASMMAATSYVHWIDMELTNTGSATILPLSRASATRCKVHVSTGIGIDATDRSTVIGCYVLNVGGAAAINSTSGSFGPGTIARNFVETGPTNNFTTGIVCSHTNVMGNIIKPPIAGNGIHVTSSVGVVAFNSIYNASAGTGKGIFFTNDQDWLGVVMNNLIEGFSGTGGQAIYTGTGSRGLTMLAGNAAFNCTANYVDTDTVFSSDNEALGASPFTAAGSDDFEPADVGNVLSGAFPTLFPGENSQTVYHDKGAIQNEPAAGAAGGRLINPSVLVG